MSDNESVKALKLLNIETVHSDGEFEFSIEVTDEFEEWFKKSKGLVASGLPQVHQILLANSIEASTGKSIKDSQ